jgi:hypothetical protein
MAALGENPRSQFEEIVMKSRDKKSPLPSGCSICRSAPFVPDPNVFGDPGWKRCECARGRALAAIDGNRAKRIKAALK